MNNTLYPILIFVAPLVAAFICGVLRRNSDSTFNWVLTSLALAALWPVIPRLLDTSFFKSLVVMVLIIGSCIAAFIAFLAFVALCILIHSLGKKCSQKFSQH